MENDPAPSTPLIAWLQEQASARESRADVVANARALANRYAELLRSARRLKGLADREPIGPSASQWGSVLAVAKRRGNDLARDLFDKDNGVCRIEFESEVRDQVKRAKAPGWKDEFFDASSGAPKTFGEWLWREIGTPAKRRLAQHLAREIQDRLKKEGIQ